MPSDQKKYGLGFVELLLMHHRQLERDGKLLPDEPYEDIALRHLQRNPRRICTLREIQKLMPAVEEADLLVAMKLLADRGMVDCLPAGPKRFNYRLRPRYRPVVVIRGKK